MERSGRSGRVQEVEGTGTIADGIAARKPFPEALADITGLVDDILLVDDNTLLEAMRYAHQDFGVVLEPAGAAGLAAGGGLPPPVSLPPLGRVVLWRRENDVMH